MTGLMPAHYDSYDDEHGNDGQCGYEQQLTPAGVLRIGRVASARVVVAVYHDGHPAGIGAVLLVPCTDPAGAPSATRNLEKSCPVLEA